MLEQAVQPIVEAIVAKAPSGWTDAVLRGRAGRGGTYVTGGYTPRRGRRDTHVPHPYAELMALAEILRNQRGWQRTSLEIRCRPSGEYRLVAFDHAITRVSSPGGFQAVLDADYRPPQPGLRQEPGIAAPAGDPELAVARLRAYLDRRAAILGHADDLPPPATAAAIDQAERRLGRRLPADLRALYTIADGDGIGYEHRHLFPGNAWLPLERLVAEHATWGVGERPWLGWNLEWDAVVFDTTPTDTVRRCGAHPGWSPFATSEDGNFLAVDMAPARNGRPGQVIRIGRDYHDGPAYVADSITSLLGHYLELLDQGAYERHCDHIDLLDGSSDPAPPEIVACSMPEEVPPTLRAIHINDAAGRVDLAPLTAAPNLRRLHLNRSTAADLTPVRELPVEALRVTLDSGDLTPLTGHPHLASLDLTTTVPADLTPLRTVPHLRGLDLSGADLSGADITDPTVLAGLSDLRYLSLTGRQWTALLNEGALPPTLVAACLADEGSTLDDALAWAGRLGLNTRNPVRVAGTLKTVGGRPGPSRSGR